MPQLYRVKFTRSLEVDKIEIGGAIVSAVDQHQAIEITARILRLSLTAAQFEVARIKPPFVELDRQIVDHKMATYDAETVRANLACVATFPFVAEVERDLYAVKIAAELMAVDERDAIGGVSRVLRRHLDGERQRPSLREFEINCERRVIDRLTSFERNANYTAPPRIFSGGAVRPK